MGRAANRGQHGTGEAAKLSPMAEVKQERSAPPAGRLEVIIGWPEMTSCKVWPQFCCLEARFGGELVGLKMLPMKRETPMLEEEDRKKWKMHLEIPVGLDWPTQSLDLAVKRLDYVPTRRNLNLIRGGPHTSCYDAVIGRAPVKLVDALIIGDEDEDEDEEANDRKKRRREEVPRMWRTLQFHETVTLEDWEMPAPDSAPRLVKRGTVEVLMGMFEP